MAVGVAVGFGHVVQLNPVEGAQLYEFTPDAVRLTEFPAQIPITVGLTETVGPTFTTTVSVY